jgi:hypothetical protein
LKQPRLVLRFFVFGFKIAEIGAQLAAHLAQPRLARHLPCIGEGKNTTRLPTVGGIKEERRPW